MIENQATEAQPCPRCQNPTRVVRNPFYGSGLSVHEWLMVCDVCKWSGFEPNADEVSADDKGPANSRLRWLRSMFNRRR